VVSVLDELVVPVVAAPMAGGISTPELVAAVSEAGGLGFLAAGYLTPDAVRDQLHATRALTGKPFGVNIFVPGDTAVDESAVDRYAARLTAEAHRYGVYLGDAIADDDGWAAKLDLVLAERVPVVSFTFGCPDADVLARLRENGSTVVVTVTSAAEARLAAAAGADVLCAQGQEAGGHRGTFDNPPAESSVAAELDPDADSAPRNDMGVLPLLREVTSAVSLPVVAAGGLGSGADVAAVLVAGAAAAQLGTLFLGCPEAGTKPAHRAALTEAAGTAVTRAFTGRPARGLVNRFLRQHSAVAPAAYPHVHHLTKSIRAAGDPEAMSLWAGQGHHFVRELPAADLVRQLAADARSALAAATRRML
jgi:nitronate monooxygenase